jgi:hypothetical protein
VILARVGGRLRDAECFEMEMSLGLKNVALKIFKNIIAKWKMMECHAAMKHWVANREQVPPWPVHHA